MRRATNLGATMYSLAIGELDRPRNLNAILRDAHETIAEARLARIKQREEDGIPLSDELPAISSLAAISEAIAVDGGEDVGATLREVYSVAAASIYGTIKPLDAYAGDPGLDGVTVTFVGLSKAAVLTFQRRCEAIDRAADDETTITDLIASKLPVWREAVAIGVGELDGLTGPNGAARIRAEDGRLSDESLDRLDSAGLTGSLWLALERFDGLTGDAKKNCGIAPPPS